MDDEDSDEAVSLGFDLALDNAWEWLCHPCDAHLFYVGVAAGNVDGFAPRYVVDAAAKEIGKLINDGELEVPDGVDPFRLADLVRALYADG